MRLSESTDLMNLIKSIFSQLLLWGSATYQCSRLRAALRLPVRNFLAAGAAERQVQKNDPDEDFKKPVTTTSEIKFKNQEM